MWETLSAEDCSARGPSPDAAPQPQRFFAPTLRSKAGGTRCSMSKNVDQQFTIESAIKNMDKISTELNKFIVKTQLLLCDLTLNFTHPVQSDTSRESVEKNQEDQTPNC